MEKKLIPGLDVLKFIMAFLIVDSHVKGYLITPLIIQQHVIHPIEGLAVPTFFVISAYLFFHKLRKQENQGKALIHFEKRLLILYSFWTLVWLPIILMQRTEYRQGSVIEGIGLFIKDFFLRDTFDASWFFVALFIGVPVVYGLGKIFKEWGVWIVPVFIRVVIDHHQDMPLAISNAYNWFATYINPNPGLSFLAGLMWISIGYILSNPKVVQAFQKIPNYGAWLLLLGLMVIPKFLPTIPVVSFLIYISSVAILFIAAYSWQLPDHPRLYKRFRAYSIIFYCFHDSYKKIPKYLFHNIHNGPLLYVITILACWLASEVILRLQDKRYFRWLRYAH